jgi:mRNA interferase MazF
MPGDDLNRYDVILVPFPFTDLSTTKVRPATIVSKESQGRDIIIAFISSVIPQRETNHTDVVLMMDDPGFAETGLRRNSVFRMSKLITIERSLIMRRLGRVPSDLQAKLDESLKRALDLSD